MSYEVGTIVRLTCHCHMDMVGPVVWIDEWGVYWVEVIDHGYVRRIDMDEEDLELVVTRPCPMAMAQ